MLLIYFFKETKRFRLDMVLKRFVLLVVLIQIFRRNSGFELKFRENMSPLLLNENLESLFDFFNFDKDFPTKLSIPIENLCLSYYNKLTYTSSKVIECAVNNSRPFHVCQNCLRHYLEYKDVLKLIDSVSIRIKMLSNLNVYSGMSVIERLP